LKNWRARDGPADAGRGHRLGRPQRGDLDHGPRTVIPGAICIALAVIAIVAISVIGSTLKSILVAACYRYAVTGQAAGGFDQAVLAGAFAPERK